MPSRVIQGDVFDVLPTLAPGSVDCVVTSPPYWMLRSYLPASHVLKRFELGSEPTVAEYIANQVRVFDLVKTALADHGVCWLNVGDTYSGSGGGGGGGGGITERRGDAAVNPGTVGIDIPEGNLCLVPQRLMISLQDAGWIVRSVVIWHKPAPMPSSVSGWSWRRCRPRVLTSGQPSGIDKRTDAAVWSDCPGCKTCKPHGGYRLRRGSWRPTSSYEPVIMLAKSASYFADGEPVKTQAKESSLGRYRCGPIRGSTTAAAHGLDRLAGNQAEDGDMKPASETTANLRDVWKIASEPLREKHYAAFPSRLVETCLRCSTSAHGYCVQCGKPWVRILESEQVKRRRPNDRTDRHEQGNGVASCGNTVAGTAAKTVGWRASCACGIDETRPGLVLDPFGGSGRTARAAQSLCLDSVIVELNPDYADMARRLIREDSPLFTTA